jgi:hypothetical protein
MSATINAKNFAKFFGKESIKNLLNNKDYDY